MLVVVFITTIVDVTLAQFHEDFCHINDFNSSKTVYQSLHMYANMEEVTETIFSGHVELGRPFAVSGVTERWRAKDKWTDGYFRSVFSGFELFSSTFATNSSPTFEPHSRRDVYYGIFINDRSLADFIAQDYSYPAFIPKHLIVPGIRYNSETCPKVVDTVKLL